MVTGALIKGEPEMLSDIVLKNRSYRRFDESLEINQELLTECVDLARLSASGANAQPLKYVLSNDRQTNAKIFSTLSWAGYLQDWPGPSEGERPSAYIVILLDTNLRKDAGCDHGIAAQSILLGAVEKGLGGCMLGSIRKQDLSETLQLPPHLEILLVIALGKPVEQVEIETVGPDGDIKYWRGEDGVHHVPKRPLEDVIVDLEGD
jgi:nitroreductase